MALREDLMALADRLDREARDIRHHPEWCRGARQSAQAIRDQIAISEASASELAPVEDTETAYGSRTVAEILAMASAERHGATGRGRGA